MLRGILAPAKLFLSSCTLAPGNMYKVDISSNYRLIFRYSIDLNTILSFKKTNKAYRNRTPNGRSKLVAIP